MKRFLRDILFTLLLGVLIVLPGEVYLAEKRDPMAYQRSYLEEHGERVRTLILGHSQTANAFDPHALGDSAFCAATPSRVIYFDRLLLEKYIDRLPNLKEVIYPMHYSFSGACLFYTNRGMQDVVVYRHAKYMKLYVDRYPAESVLATSAFLSGQLRVGNLADDGYIDSLGYSPWEGHTGWQSEDDVKQIRREEFTTDLAAMARLCHEHGVRLVIITCPFSNAALEHVTDDGVRNMYEVVEQVDKQYPVEYRNYLDAGDFRDDSLYHDWSHLDKRGATLFAQRVKEDFNL